MRSRCGLVERLQTLMNEVSLTVFTITVTIGFFCFVELKIKKTKLNVFLKSLFEMIQEKCIEYSHTDAHV